MNEAISISYLFAIGILLIGLEVVTFSFILFFIGIGFILVSALSFIYPFDNALMQIALALVFALVTAFIFRKKILNKISKQNNKEHHLHTSGIGYIEKDAVKFDGTYWQAVNDISEYNDGDKVEIISVIDNKVVIGSKTTK